MCEGERALQREEAADRSGDIREDWVRPNHHRPMQGQAFVRGRRRQVISSALAKADGALWYVAPDVIEHGHGFSAGAVRLVAPYYAVEELPQVLTHLFRRCTVGGMSCYCIESLDVDATVEADAQASRHLASEIRTKGTMTSSSDIPPWPTVRLPSWMKAPRPGGSSGK